MLMQVLRLRAVAVCAGAAILVFSGWASADPPARVGRLGYTAGAVSFSPAGESDWDRAAINRPLGNGDRLWTDAGARAEIQVGGALLRMNDGTGISVLNLDDRIAQIQLTQGTLNVRLRRLDSDQVFEVDTPNLAFTLRQPGDYRIEVEPDGSATTIVVRKGQGEVYGDGAAYVVDARQPYRFAGTGLREYQRVDAPRADEFDRWASARDRSYDNSTSARYVSPDVIGYQDLDANGTWRVDPGYGNVWVPSRVDAGWAPYRDGHWAWVDPWGWTWVDDAPWGFAVSHYGRWANMRGTWGWVPGPVRTRAYYAPALVAFVGGDNFQLSVSGGNVAGIGWFPLAPREVYRPSYAVSRGYFEKVNRSNAVITTTVINNTYNTTNVSNVVYANRHVQGAFIAVPRTTFVQAQPVAKAAVRVSREILAGAPVAAIAPVAPTGRSMHGAAGPGDKPPPARVFERPVIARTAPAPAHAGFAAQQTQLNASPGRPVDENLRHGLKPGAAAPVPVVKVVAPAQLAAPKAPPPAVAPAVTPGDGRARPDEHKVVVPPAAKLAPADTPRTASPAPATPPPEPRGKFEQRGQAAMPPPAQPPQRAAEPKTPVPQLAQPVPVTPAVPLMQRPGRQEPKHEPAPAAREADVQPAAVAPKPVPSGPQKSAEPKPAAAPQKAAEPKPVPVAVVPPVPVAREPAQRPVPPKPAPAQQVVPPAAPPAQVPHPPKPEPAPAVTKPSEPRPAAAAPKPAAEPHDPQATRGAEKPKDKKDEGDEQKRKDDGRRQKD